jgi:hypothetical protein
MNYTYRFIEEKHMGDSIPVPHECQSCGSVAPLADFKINASDATMRQVAKELCEICASTFIGNVTNYDRVYTVQEKTVCICVAQVANLLLDKLTCRRDGI